MGVYKNLNKGLYVLTIFFPTSSQALSIQSNISNVNKIMKNISNEV